MIRHRTAIDWAALDAALLAALAAAAASTPLTAAELAARLPPRPYLVDRVRIALARLHASGAVSRTTLRRRGGPPTWGWSIAR